MNIYLKTTGLTLEYNIDFFWDYLKQQMFEL